MKKVKNIYLVTEKLTEEEKEKYGYGFTGLVFEMEDGTKYSHHSTDPIQPFGLINV